MHPVESYLKTLSEIHSTGGATAETSYYGALETLLNEVGAKLKPKVRAVSQLANTGAGSPDFGLYSANQFQRAKDENPIDGILPERGVVEVKGWADKSLRTAKKEQVSKYWEHYNLVLVTNYRDFVLLGKDDCGKPAILETYHMAESESEFRALLAQPHTATTQQGDRLLDFLRRVLLYKASLTEPEDLAWFLASYAREARYRVEAAKGIPALESLKKGLEEALGMQFDGEKGEHFFQATLVQTLFYGIFSSWVLWSRDHGDLPDARFDWHNAAWTLHIPMIASLFHQISTPQKLKPLGVDEVLDWAGTALGNVNRAAFFAKFEEENAVQYFYEPFLKAYDPELRKDLGVWYTPHEIVKYQVERVDRALRDELGIADGLADDNVVILDPCCGTGAYLVETLKRIHKTLKEKGSGALTAQKLKKAAIERVFGFEILPAPFVVSHLQLGLLLRQLGAPLDPEKSQRAGVFLTNALTGWEPLEKPKNELPLYPELMDERDAANEVKQDAPILVIIGNPPYNAFSGTSPEEEGGLVDVYKEGLTQPVNQGGWGIKKFNLDDLYIRFFRIAERRIAKSRKGVVCYISNFSYLGDPSFVAMRKQFLTEFDKLWFDCMNGDSRETGKLTPDGKPDPSVFSTKKNRVGIRVGTAIGLMVRKEKRLKTPIVRFQHFWGIAKHQDLLTQLNLKQINRKYEVAKPTPKNRYSFRPITEIEEYGTWPNVTELCAVPPSNGLMEKRGGALIDIDRGALEKRIVDYYDTSLDWDGYRTLKHGLEIERAGFDPKKVRTKALQFEPNIGTQIVPYALRPFDHVWAYYSSVPGVWNRSRPTYWAQCWDGNSFFVTRPSQVSAPEGIPVYWTSILGDNDFQRGHSYYFPLRLRNIPQKAITIDGQKAMFSHEKVEPSIKANLSNRARSYLAHVSINNPDHDSETAGLIWMHALALGNSPAYLRENADGLKQNWPRIPLPLKKKTLLHSNNLGQRIAALFDTSKPVESVTCGQIVPCFAELGIIRKVGGGSLDLDTGELDLTAGWGHAGARGACMPGRGKIERRARKTENSNDSPENETLDIYLNETAYWSNVPPAVWNFTIGGYQVIKKWLSYREKRILGRCLKIEEVEFVTEMIRRIAALILLQPELDSNYEDIKANTWPWPTE